MKHLTKKQTESPEIRCSDEQQLSISEMLKVRGGEVEPPKIKVP